MNDWDLNPEKYLVDDQGNFTSAASNEYYTKVTLY